MRKYLPCFLLLPLLFVNVSNSHDWGDDFAQYLIQTKNILEHKAQSDNGLVFDPAVGRFAVDAYPVGFPLLLLPVVAMTGIAIKPLLILESVFLIALCSLCVLYFRKEFAEWLAWGMVLILAYHPFTIDLKAQILSEIPFTFFLMAVIYQWESVIHSRKNLLITGLLLGFLASIRITGILVAIALLLQSVFQEKDTVTNENKNYSVSRSGILILLASAIFFLLNKLLLPVNMSSFFGFYNAAANEYGMHPLQNLMYYSDQLSMLFILPLPFYEVWKFIVLILVCTGWILTFRKKRSLAEWFSLIYVMTLLFYPYTSGGFRFLFPVFPFLVYYFFSALKYFLSKTKIIRTSVLIPVICIVLLIFPVLGIADKSMNSSSEISGPQMQQSLELFSYLHEFTDSNSIVVFPRARAMVLYGGRRTTYRLNHLTAEENDQLFEKLGVNYLILPMKPRIYNLYDPALNTYYSVNYNKYALAWKNDAFEVYRRN